MHSFLCSHPAGSRKETLMDTSDGDDVRVAGLSLRLNYDGRGDLSVVGDHHPRPSAGFKLERSSSTATSVEPYLTLGLPGDGWGSAKAQAEEDKACSASRVVGRPSSPHSMVSSFSGGHVSRIKRERDARVSDEEEDGGAARKKLRLTKEQSALLEDRFREHSSLDPKQKQALAGKLNLRPRQVEVWFQNRRARTKLKKTEVEYERLRKCCETLRDENRRLQKELQELKSFKLLRPRYMQLPATAVAGFTMCPSCSTVAAARDSDESGSLVVAPKPRLFNPFAHSASL
ncbi:hypothetical protein C4D60_Mb06t32490 [Musa balbisiana]|uniref:Homeobox domain-containing protein n=1 Tax=Musa balbisiana TaxID=52838 RepID=A0A4S8IS95_MUSBA|nr:hypothetical protein C4D60_Mb06t32490 [Musa balbisiana]